MAYRSLQRILAGCSIAGLLTATILPAGCSRQEDIAEKQEGQERAHKQQDSAENDTSKKATKPDGTEVQIRGDSG